MNRDIAHLLKSGNKDLIQQMLKERESQVLPESFTQYMDEMIASKKLKRAQIAQRAGLSRDYLYKLLRGDKKTTERDYILAVCIAMSMNLHEAQHALEIYPFPLLDDSDARDEVIITGINEGVSIDTLDDWLELCEFPLLRTSPDMPSADLGPRRSTSADPSMAQSYLEKSISNRRKNMEELYTKVDAQHCGNAPFDYVYVGEIQVKSGTEIFYVQGIFPPDGCDSFQVAKKTLFSEEDFSEEDYVEGFESLEDAAGSDFFKYYLKIDKLTDQKVAEVMAEVDDTKFAPGNLRIGAKFSKDCYVYCEFYNERQPERQEYLQVTKTRDGFIYSACHDSCFMRIELDEMYPYYFNKKKDPDYYIYITSLDDLPEEYEYFRWTYQQMEILLNREVKEMFGGDFFGITISDEDLLMPPAPYVKIGRLRSGSTKRSRKIVELEVFYEKEKQYVAYINDPEFISFNTNTQSFYDAFFVDKSIKAGLTMRMNYNSREEAMMATDRKAFAILEAVMNDGGAEKGYCWKPGDPDPYGIGGLLNT